MRSFSMENKAKNYDWRTCLYCGADYDRWCHAAVIKQDVVGYPEEVEVNCSSCGAAYRVQRVILWRILQEETLTANKCLHE